MRRWLALVAAGAAALAAPGGALAADHLYLDVSARLGGSLAGWRLSVHVDSGDVYSTSDPTPVDPASLTRGGFVFVQLTRRKGRVDERHDVAGTPTSDTIRFDGEAGDVDLRGELGRALTLRMTIAATGSPTPTSRLACTGGSFVSAPVRLDGTLILATQTRLFGTIRLASIAGRLIYNLGGPVERCFDYPIPDAVCTAPPYEDLSATSLVQPGESGARPRAALGARWSTKERFVYLAWHTYPDGPASPDWAHALFVDVRRRPFSGPATRLRVRFPASGPLRGSGVLTTRGASAIADPECGTVDVTSAGSFDGVFRGVWHGWGRLTFHASWAGQYAAARPLR